jgi:D-aminopeptidase
MMRVRAPGEAFSTARLTPCFDEQKIDAIFAELDRCHSPGAAVGISIGGRPVYRKGFGLANVELPVVLSPTIRMHLASVSKHFTALTYMLLCEQGRAGVDDCIGTYLPELHPVTREVTMRQLMGNISGLRDANDICWQFSGTAGPPVSSAELLRLYCDIDDVEAAPGTTFIYNNGGWLILSAVIERVTGQLLEEVLQEQILDPVGMRDTVLCRWDNELVPNSAALHSVNEGGKLQRSSLRTASAGSGGMMSTVDDMLRWMANMDAPIVGTPRTWRLMRTPLILANGTSTGYGMGLVLGAYRGIETLSHGGAANGGNTQMLKVPAAGLDVIVMVNRHDVFSNVLVDRILDACLPDLMPVKVTNGLATGTFHSPATGRVIQLGRASPHPWIETGRQVASIDGLDLTVEPDGEGVLWPSGGAEYLKLSLQLVGDPREPSAIRFSDFGNPDHLVRVQTRAEPDGKAIAGRYRSPGTGTEATILANDERIELITVGRFGSAKFKLVSLADGIWRATAAGPIPWGGVLTFDAENTLFRFSNNLRTRHLPFRRCAG